MMTTLASLPERPEHQVAALRQVRTRGTDATRVKCTCGEGVTTDTIQEAAAWWSIHRDSR